MDAVLLGTGWRARFYMRIAGFCPDILRIVAVFTHTPERKAEMEAEGFSAFTDIASALAVDHDAVIIASGKNGFSDTLRYLHGRRERIITETTFLGLPEEDLEEFSSYDGLVMEQYWNTPLFSSLLNALSALEAEPDQLYLSGLHNHHSASIARRVLGTGYQMPEEIQSLSFPSSIVRTGSRRGLEVSGESEEYVRNIREMKLGKSLFIHDFSSNQYHSYLYGKHFEVRSRRCVITEKGVSGIDREGYPYSMPFIFHRDSSIGSGSLALSHVTLGERTVFVNPYYPLAMNDDEIAMAMMLEQYGEGHNPYPFCEGVMDARLGKLL